MNIQFDKKNRVFKLDTENTSYVMAVVDNEGFLGHVYYGARISDTDVAYLLRTDENPMVPSKNNRDRSSFLDTFPMEYPGNGVGDYRESAIAVLDKNGHSAVQTFYRFHQIFSGKKKIPGLPASFAKETECQTLEIVTEDPVLGLEAVLVYTVFAGSDVITRSVRVTNHAAETIALTKVMSASFDMDADDYEMLSLHGSWARERQIEQRTIGYGKQSAGSVRGESSHQEHPFVALVSKNADRKSVV